jgi:serine/threonine protein kinase
MFYISYMALTDTLQLTDTRLVETLESADYWTIATPSGELVMRRRISHNSKDSVVYKGYEVWHDSEGIPHSTGRVAAIKMPDPLFLMRCDDKYGYLQEFRNSYQTEALNNFLASADSDSEGPRSAAFYRIAEVPSGVIPAMRSSVDLRDDISIPVLITEYIHGPSLKELIDRRNTAEFSFKNMKSIFFQIGLIVDDLEEQGLLHLDLKPDHFILSNGEIRVIDFGISRFYPKNEKNLRQSQNVTGTLRYFAPERITSTVITAKAEQYAVGIMAYNYLTGEYPFGNFIRGYNILMSDPNLRGKVSELECKAAALLIKEQVAKRFTPITPDLLPTGYQHPIIATRVNAVFERVFEVKPEARFKSVKEFAYSLMTALNSPV